VYAALSGRDGVSPLLAVPANAEHLRHPERELELIQPGPSTQARVYVDGEHALVSSGSSISWVRFGEDGALALERQDSLPSWVLGAELHAQRALLALGAAGARWAEAL